MLYLLSLLSLPLTPLHITKFYLIGYSRFLQKICSEVYYSPPRHTLSLISGRLNALECIKCNWSLHKKKQPPLAPPKKKKPTKNNNNNHPGQSSTLHKRDTLITYLLLGCWPQRVSSTVEERSLLDSFPFRVGLLSVTLTHSSVFFSCWICFPPVFQCRLA